MKLFLFIYLIIIQFILETDLLSGKIFLNICEIKLTIVGTGNQRILYNNFDSYGGFPNEVYLGEEKINNITSTINLTKNENIIKLRWNSTFENCHKMFYECVNITEIDFSSFNNPDINDTSQMFYRCESLTSINFSNFYTSKVTTMEYMFFDCCNLTTLNLSTFDTSNVEYMNGLFAYCEKIKFLNLSNFNISQVVDTSEMFYDCYDLISLDLSGFGKSIINSMSFMFSGCINLISINLSNFYSSNQVVLYDTFSYCLNLIQIDLSKLSSVTMLIMTFYHCESLTYLNFPNFELTSRIYYSNIFFNCRKLKYINLSNAIDNSSLNYISFFQHIEDGLKVCINETKAPKLYQELLKINSVSFVCSFKPCINNSFYDDGVYKCTNTEECPIKYDKLIPIKRECVDDCSKDDIYRYEFRKKCYSNCSIDNFTLKYKGYLCDIQCPKELPFEMIEFQECVSNCTINEILLNLCKLKYEEETLLDTFLDNILEELESNNLDINILNNNSNITFEINGITFMITKIKIADSINKRRIELLDNDLYDCLYKLRIIYNLQNEEYFYLLNIQIIHLGIKKNIYRVYYYSNKKKILKRIDLTQCEKNKDIFEMAKCEKYSVESIMNNLCISCDKNNGFYELYNETNNLFKNCYKNINGYYLDNNKIFKPCYSTCLTCEKEGNETNHNCITCNNKNPYKSDTNCYNYSIDCSINNKYKFREKCYEKCPEGSINSKENKLFCEVVCTKDLPYELISTQECIKSCSINDKLKGLCKLNYDKENMTHQNEQLDDIRNMITKEIDITQLDNEKDLIFKESNFIYSFTNTENQKKIERINNSAIHFGECEDKLKSKYNISKEESLYILKVEIFIEGMKNPKVEYEVYYPLFNSTLILLDLSVCLNMKIDILYPNKINIGTLDKVDINSGYYNDICYSTTSIYGTDIILKDRRDEFINYNLSVCEEECNLKNYNNTLEKTTCSCDVKIKIGSFTEIKFDKLILLRRFTSLYSISNLNVMQCNQFVFNSNIIFKNIGFYLITVIIIFGISCLGIFYFKEYYIFNITINQIITEKRKKIKDKNEIIVEESKIKGKNEIIIEENKMKKKRKIRRNSVIEDSNLRFKDNTKFYLQFQNNIKKSPPIKKNKKIVFPNSNIKKRRNSSALDANNFILNMLNSNQQLIKNKDNKITNELKVIKEVDENKEIKIKTEINIDELWPQEINSLSYDNAKKYDKRNFSIYYISLLRMKHILIFTFYTKDYNSRIIKIYLFFFTFAINFTINTLFFDDTNMHKIYKDKGHFNFVYQLPNMIYSSLITTILNAILKLLALYENNIMNIKNTKIEDLDEKLKEERKKIKIKLILYFTITYSLLILFWYYLCCFCGVYKNTQVYLLKNTLFSFFTSLLTPFGIYILPSIFRILSLKTKKKRKCLYNFSKLLQLI